MSNFLAIATATATLAQTLLSAAEDAVTGTTVTNIRPDSPGNGAAAKRVNLYLYQVTPNAAFRNTDLPTRNSDGGIMNRPRAALDLHYLLTFYGSEADLEPQRLLGSVVRALHAKPVLTRQMIEGAIASHPFLASSNLADEVELIKFTPIPLSLEDLSKLWSVFFQTQYSLSIAYQGTVVLIESEESPHTSLPVRKRNILVTPFHQPVIDGIQAQEGANASIVLGSTLLISGKRLLGDITEVRIGGMLVPASDVTETLITLRLLSPPLPAGLLRAGVQGVQVVQKLKLGSPADPHPSFESNVAAFVLRPTIKKDANGKYQIAVQDVEKDGDNAKKAKITVSVDPEVGPRQRVVLLLNAGTGEAYSFNAEARDKNTSNIDFQIRKVMPGNYLVRLQVDGAESSPDVDTDPTSASFNQYIAPKVAIP